MLQGLICIEITGDTRIPCPKRVVNQMVSDVTSWFCGTKAQVFYDVTITVCIGPMCEHKSRVANKWFGPQYVA